MKSEKSWLSERPGQLPVVLIAQLVEHCIDIAEVMLRVPCKPEQDWLITARIIYAETVFNRPLSKVS